MPKLTVKQLQIYLEQELSTMNQRFQRSEYESTELHLRVDRMIAQLDEFKKEVRSEFEDIREKMTQSRDEFNQFRLALDEQLIAIFQAMTSSFHNLEHEVRELKKQT